MATPRPSSINPFVSVVIDPFLAIPITTVALFFVGVLVQLAFLRPLRKEDRAELSLLVTRGALSC